MANNPYASSSKQRNTRNACVKNTSQKCGCAPFVAILLAGAIFGGGMLTYKLGFCKAKNQDTPKPTTSQTEPTIQPTQPTPTNPKPTQPAPTNPKPTKPEETTPTKPNNKPEDKPEDTPGISVKPQDPPSTEPEETTPPPTEPEETTPPPTEPVDPLAGIGIENQGVNVGKKDEDQTPTETSYSLDYNKKASDTAQSTTEPTTYYTYDLEQG